MSQTSLKSVIIVAGGSGKRMNSEIPKQFLIIGGKPVLMHTIEVFYNFDNNLQIVLVLPENQFDYWNQLCEKFKFNIKVDLVSGGLERFFSVKNGLQNISFNEGLVAIHDGVRPLVDKDLIIRGIETAEKSKAAIPVISEANSIRIIENNSSFHFDRSKIKLVQTPQIFQIELLKKAYEENFEQKFTDDASVVENLGFNVALFEGSDKNIKITTKLDLEFADFLISKNNKI